MKYEIGHLVRIIQGDGLTGMLERRWIGTVGQIKQMGTNGRFDLLFDLEMEENKKLKESYSRNPETAYFGTKDVEPYIQDINFLD